MRRGPYRRAALALGSLGLVTVSILQISRTIEVRSYDEAAPVCRVQTAQRSVSLTFDDGPDPSYTPRVLELLKADGATATFFLIGSKAASQPDLVDAEVAAGMQIADHTQTHVHLARHSVESALAEADQARATLQMHTADITLFRAPFGELTPAQAKALQRDHFTVVGWSLALDRYANGSDPASAARALAADIRPGDIILAHDSALYTGARGGEREIALSALGLLLSGLRARGFAVTTVDRLLASGTPVPADARPWFWQSGFSCPR